MKPLCFVLMPFGTKKDENGREINFDVIYSDMILPAIEAADMEAVRADEEMVGGVIHKPMYERLLMCEYAIADLTTANANVFYELGIRHAARAHSTLSIFSSDSVLPFDLQPVRTYPYTLGKDAKLENVDKDRENIVKWLMAARKPAVDSPLFQFFDELKPQEISHAKTDIFRENVEYSNKIKKRLKRLRKSKDLEALKEFEDELKIEDTEGGILIDLYLSYRAIDAWSEMVELEDKMPNYLQKSLLVREQLGFALNRLGESGEAEEVLLETIEEYGASSESLGLLGRVYKDMWENEGNKTRKESYLKRTIDTYIRGYETDIRDAYPGVNAITLMALLDELDERFSELLPVVLYAVKRRLARTKPDYWDYATLMELEVIARNAEGARQALLGAVPLADEDWMLETTLKTINRLCNHWSQKGEDVDWLEEIKEGLSQ